MSTGYSSIEEIKEKYKEELESWKEGDEEAGIYNSNNDYKNLLCMLAREGYDIEAVKFLIEHGVDPNEDYNYKTPLHYAIEDDNLELVKYLVEKCDADVNDYIGGKLNDHYYPLTLADSPEMAKYLIEKGAEMEVPTYFGWFLRSFDIRKPVEEYINKLLNEAIEKQLKEKEEEEEDEEEEDATLITHVIHFEDEEITKKLDKEEFKKWYGYCGMEEDNEIRFLDEDGEIDENKFQAVADKYQVEFYVWYYPANHCRDDYIKKFKPK